jgi:heterotetrameric sarcosine oxidase gamma subunit
MNPYSTSPLESKHSQLAVGFIERTGWRIPDLYTSLENELAGVRQHAGLADLSAKGKLNLKNPALPEFLIRALKIQSYLPGNLIPVQIDHRQLLLAALTSDEALLLTPPGQERQVIDYLGQTLGEFLVSFVDRTGGLAGLLLAGPSSRMVIAKLSALSVQPRDFPNFHVAQTSFAKIHATILRRDLGSLPAFELYFDRSYAEYLWEALLDAGHEFSLHPIGWQTLNLLQDGKPEK